MGWRRRSRKRFEETMDTILPPKREPFLFPYDLDYVPPPPQPEPMMAPLGNEPKDKRGVPLTLRKAGEYVGKSGHTYIKGRLYTADGMEYVQYLLSSRAHIGIANMHVQAFEPDGEERRGVITPERVKSWVGRTVLADLRWESWDFGAAWTVRRICSLQAEESS